MESEKLYTNYSIKTLVDIDCPHIESLVQVDGWIKSIRLMKNMCFTIVNDGSSSKSLQCIIKGGLYDSLMVKNIGTGSAISLKGVLKKSRGTQDTELDTHEILFSSEIDAAKYPLQKKKHSIEFIRSLMHLRAQTSLFSSIMRIRNTVSMATHEFFQSKEFLLTALPILTKADCEGGGETFKIDDSKSKIFDSNAFLTVSTQLHAESLAIGLKKVYSFGPTFRAENSNTSRHLAEFWMVEPEVAFMGIDGLIDLSISYIKYVITCCLSKNKGDILVTATSEGHLEKLHEVVSSAFKIITYKEAISSLEKNNFSDAVKFGDDLGSSAEKFLTQYVYKAPIVVKDMPKTLKAFYMKENDDNETVAAMDVLLPGIGELIGGGQREESLKKMVSTMQKRGISTDDYQWYLDTRRFGNVPHSGFGVGLERFVQYISDIDNIRDTIPFPRSPGQIQF